MTATEARLALPLPSGKAAWSLRSSLPPRRRPARRCRRAGPRLCGCFNQRRRVIRRLVSHSQLNSPWGLALAPAGFGGFARALLIGRFGDGHINAYNPGTGTLSEPASRAERPQDRHRRAVGPEVRQRKRRQNRGLLLSAGPNGEAGGLLEKSSSWLTPSRSAATDPGCRTRNLLGPGRRPTGALSHTPEANPSKKLVLAQDRGPWPAPARHWPRLLGWLRRAGAPAGHQRRERRMA